MNVKFSNSYYHCKARGDLDLEAVHHAKTFEKVSKK